MIIDVTGIVLIPGNNGRDCPGNGKHVDKNGHVIECCCDECDYMACCLDNRHVYACAACEDYECPLSKRNRNR